VGEPESRAVGRRCRYVVDGSTGETCGRPARVIGGQLSMKDFRDSPISGIVGSMTYDKLCEEHQPQSIG
jgi:hypothetical protein